MKSYFLALAAVLACAAMWVVGCSAADKYTSDPSVLPTQAQTLIKDNFSDLHLGQIKIDSDDYEVQFTNGTKVEFTKSGLLKEVKAAAGTYVPEALVLPAVKSYIDTTYPGQRITKYETGRDIEATLSSGIELKFSKEGRFLHID